METKLKILGECLWLAFPAKTQTLFRVGWSCRETGSCKLV